jgi:hypothetical protein
MQNITALVMAWYVSLSSSEQQCLIGSAGGDVSRGDSGNRRGRSAALIEAVHDQVDVVLEVHVDALSLELELSPKEFLQVGLVGDAKSKVELGVD